jgi:hypothetical protein
VVHGIPGIGKSTVAVRAAYDAIAAFPDGVLYFDLHGYHPEARRSPGSVFSEVLAILGRADLTRLPEHDLSGAFRAAVADKSVPINS